MNALLDKNVVKLQFSGAYVPLIKEAINAAKGNVAFPGTQWREAGRDVQMMIPVKEAGAWMALLQDMSDEIRDQEVDKADKFEYVCDMIAEEAEKILGPVESAPVAEKTGPKKFWKGW